MRCFFWIIFCLIAVLSVWALPVEENADNGSLVTVGNETDDFAVEGRAFDDDEDDDDEVIDDGVLDITDRHFRKKPKKHPKKDQKKKKDDDDDDSSSEEKSVKKFVKKFKNVKCICQKKKPSKKPQSSGRNLLKIFSQE